MSERGVSRGRGYSGRSLSRPTSRDCRRLPEGVPQHDGVLSNTPVLQEHCADDPLVLGQNARGLRDTLQGFGAR